MNTNNGGGSDVTPPPSPKSNVLSRTGLSPPPSFHDSRDKSYYPRCETNTPSVALNDGPSSSSSSTSPCPTIDASTLRLLEKEAQYNPLDDHRSCNKSSQKRRSYLSWDDFFVSIAQLTSLRSKDPEKRVGACIVKDNIVIGIGYNGFPRGCSDDVLPWSGGGGLRNKEAYVVHAEVNAILNKGSADVKGAVMYVTDFPCNECAKIIIQSEIREVVYLRDDERDSDARRASRVLFGLAGVSVRHYAPSRDHVLLDFGLLSDDDTSAAADDDDDVVASDGPVETTTIDPDIVKLLRDEADLDVASSSSCTTAKRASYLSWEDYFISLAFLTSLRSKDPNTQVGAAIISPSNTIIGLGYNGFPRGCSDDVLPWSRTNSNSLHTKYPFVVHAEVNAILNKCAPSVAGCRIYVALFPCNDCAKVIIQSGIKEVVYLCDRYRHTDSVRASRIMFHMAGVRTRFYKPSTNTIKLQFSSKQ